MPGAAEQHADQSQIWPPHHTDIPQMDATLLQRLTGAADILGKACIAMLMCFVIGGRPGQVIVLQTRYRSIE